MFCAIWYHLYNLKNVKNTHGGVLLLVTKSNPPPWVLFTFLKFYKWYQIAQRITYKRLFKWNCCKKKQIIFIERTIRKKISSMSQLKNGPKRVCHI